MDCDTLFQRIQTQLNEINVVFIQSINGEIFTNSRLFIEKVRNVLNIMKLTFVEKCDDNETFAFTNINDIGLDIEVKITDNNIINFNDTCPSEKIYYVIFFTGQKGIFPPQLLFLKGDIFLKNDKWVLDYVSELKALKNKYVYNTQTDILYLTNMFNFKADISKFIKS